MTNETQINEQKPAELSMEELGKVAGGGLFGAITGAIVGAAGGAVVGGPAGAAAGVGAGATGGSLAEDLVGKI